MEYNAIMSKQGEQPVMDTLVGELPPPPQKTVFELAQEQLLKKVGWIGKTFAEVAADPKTIDKLKNSMEYGKITQSEFVMAVGMIASLVIKGQHRSVGLVERNKDIEGTILNKATHYLRSWEVKPSNRDKHPGALWQMRVDAAEKAHSWLRSFESPIPSEVVAEELPSEEGQGQTIVEQPTPTEIVVSALDFEVLPHAKDGDSGNIIEFLGKYFEGQSLDEERVKFIASYTERYNGELFVSKFGRENLNEDSTVKIPLHNKDEADEDLGFRFNYLVAVFDKEVGGKLVKFAVAEYVRKNKTVETDDGEQRVAHGAIYVFEEKLGSELTWQAVLSKTRDQARALGAHKITHRGEFAERLEKLLGTTTA